MGYDPTKQNRLSIIRSKGKKQLDELLFPMARLVEDITPCSQEEFNNQFDIKFPSILPKSSELKTVRNYRTEIVRSLYGLVIFSGNQVLPSDRLQRLLQTSDQTALFKEIALKLQFPFGGWSPGKLSAAGKYSLRPGPFVVQLLDFADKKGMTLKKDEIYYFALNNKDVQLGRVSPTRVLQAVIRHRRRKKSKRGPLIPASSYATQHLREILNYLELGMLIQTNKNDVWLRKSESKSIKTFLNIDSRRVEFNPAEYGTYDDMRKAWDSYYTSLDDSFNKAFSADAAASTGVKAPKIKSKSNNELGKLGEEIVLDFERRRLKYDAKLLRLVVDRAHEKCGYDIQSANGNIAMRGLKPSDLIEIEVKTTRRSTLPSDMEADNFDITQNEWKRAEKQRNRYFIYRVYITSGPQVNIARVSDPWGQSGKGLLLTPTKFSVQTRSPRHEMLQFEWVRETTDKR